MLCDGSLSGCKCRIGGGRLLQSRGGTSLYDSSPLQLHLRDIHAFTQHILVADEWFIRTGTFLVGNDPGFGICYAEGRLTTVSERDGSSLSGDW